MNQEKLLAILRLQKSKAIGDILAKKLITATGNVEQIFKEKKHKLQKINGIGNHITNHLFDANNLKSAEKELNYINKNKIEFSYFLDDDYPENLQHCIDGPILIFKDGNIDFSNQKLISIVGTRNITSYGRDFCNQLIEDLQVGIPVQFINFRD